MDTSGRSSGTRGTRPLWRNRDFVLFESGLLLSSLGTSLATIAYPLLTLAVTHSPAKAGLVGFARLAPYAFFSLIAGVAADRWRRKPLMIASDAVRAVALGTFAAFLAGGGVAFWTMSSSRSSRAPRRACRRRRSRRPAEHRAAGPAADRNRRT